MSKGAFYSMPSIEGTGLNSDKIENILLNKLGITTVSGKSFGVFGEGYIRLSYANSDENIKKAMFRIKEFIETIGWHNA
jgi:aspartate/methionine/tyrosine aminotransferase